MSAEMAIASHWRMKEQRYALKGKAQLTTAEIADLTSRGLSLSQLLTCSREELEKILEENEPEMQLYALSELGILMSGR